MDLRKLINKLLRPPVWIALIILVACATVIPFVLINGWGEHPLAVVSYVPAAYLTAVVTFACIRTLPGWYRRIKKAVYDNPVGHRYMTDAVFKVRVSLYFSLTVNLLYVAVNVLSGIFIGSAWFHILAGYYIILSVMRFLLLRFVNHNELGRRRYAELRRSRICAVILLFVNLSLSGAVMMMMYMDRGYEYPGILIYVMAAFTFFITVNAVRNIIRYRKYNSPILTTAKVISLASALVSMLSLETAMLTEFSKEDSETFRRIMIASTGAGISIIVVSMSVLLIVHTTKQIRIIKEKAARRQLQRRENGKQ